MEQPPKVETVFDMIRAFHFPHPRLSELLWCLAGAGALGLTLWVLSRVAEARRRASLPAPLKTPASQRRDSFRVSVSFPADVIPEGAAVPLSGTICDLSASGVTVIMDQPNPLWRYLRIAFEADTGAFEGLRVEIVRSAPAEWSRRHYLHCRFLDLSPPEEQRLLRAVAERERRLLRSP